MYWGYAIPFSAVAHCTGLAKLLGLNIPQIELLAIWVGGMHCVIVTKLFGARFFWGGGFKHAPQKVGGNKKYIYLGLGSYR